jgi:hypothetical protein
MSDLRDIIASSLTEQDPATPDNLEAEVTEALDADESLEDNDGFEVEEAEDAEVEADEESEETEEQEDTDGEKFTVKVDGETFEVTLDELKSGYQRQADYTREKQALKKEIEQFEEVKLELSDTIQGIQQLDEAWEENPIQVLAHFTANTQNPTHAVALLIKELAVANLLDQAFLDTFGVTPEIRNQWAQETEVQQLRGQVSKTASKRDQELESAKIELEIQKALAEYERQVDEIIAAEGLNLTVTQRNEFRQRLAKYASENELTNLKAAYKAFQYEQVQQKKAVAKRTAEKAKQKKAASVSARSGSSADGGVSLTDTSDLASVIQAALRDTQSNLGNR